MKNRYDMLMAQATKLRNKSYKINTRAEARVEKLRSQINKIKNTSRVRCKELNERLIDVNSLIVNEQRRIMRDAEIFGTKVDGGNE